MTDELTKTATDVSAETGVHPVRVGEYVRHEHGTTSRFFIVEIGEPDEPKYVASVDESLTRSAVLAVAEWKHKGRAEAERLAERLRSMGYDVTPRAA